MKLSLEQTQALNKILDSDYIVGELEDFIACFGYDESNESDLEYRTETITYEHRVSTPRRD
jgi:hypothetical protein